jgi:hypothetical protein
MNSGYKMIQSNRAAMNPSPLVAGGGRAAVDLINGVQTHGFFVTVTGQLDVTVNCTSVINGGDVLGALTFFLNMNGEDVARWDGLISGFMTQVLAPSLVGNRLIPANANIQAATVVRSQAFLWMVNPQAVIPRETAFQENDPRQRFQLQAEITSGATAAAAAAGILRIGAGAATLTNITVNVEQHYVANETALPFFRPRIREQVDSVAAANTAMPSRIFTNNRIRGLCIKQETDGAGLVTDIITALALRGDNGDIWGPQQVPWVDAVRQMELQYGGGVSATSPYPNGSLLYINFQPYGRLASVLYPYRDVPNFRVEYNCLPSVTAGATNSRIRTSIIELERPAPVQDRNIVTPTLPDFLDS